MISSLELARLCGVSQGTVDRALHDRPGISAKTRERILRLARQQGYRPNPAVRELITGQSRTIGAVIPVVNNIFFMDLFQDLAARLAERGLKLQLSPVRDRAEFLEALEEFAGRRHRLALVIPPEEIITIPRTITAGLPIISLLSECRGQGVRFISADEEETGRRATRYLLDQGHRGILHLTYERRSYAIAARARGYRRALAKQGLKSRGMIYHERAELLTRIKKEKITAIFCHNDWLALKIILALAETGLRVPEDISVIGVDHSPTLSALHPHLTTLAYPLAAMADAVLASLDDSGAKISRMTCELVEGGTVKKLTKG